MVMSDMAHNFIYVISLMKSAYLKLLSSSYLQRTTYNLEFSSLSLCYQIAQYHLIIQGILIFDLLNNLWFEVVIVE